MMSEGKRMTQGVKLVKDWGEVWSGRISEVAKSLDDLAQRIAAAIRALPPRRGT